MKRKAILVILAISAITVIFCGGVLITKILQYRGTILELHAQVNELQTALAGDLIPNTKALQRIIIEATVIDAPELPDDWTGQPYAEAKAIYRLQPKEAYYGTLPPSDFLAALWVASEHRDLPHAALKKGSSVLLDLLPLDEANAFTKQAFTIDAIESDFSESVWAENYESQLAARFRGKTPPKISLPESNFTNASFRSELLPHFLKSKRLQTATRTYLSATTLFQPVYGDVSAPVGILDFANYLSSKGIQFLYVSIPTKPEVFPEDYSNSPLSQQLQLLSPARAEMLQFLADQGISVLDLTEALRRVREKESKPPFMPSVQDPHLSPFGCRAAASAIIQAAGLATGGSGAMSSVLVPSETQDLGPIPQVLMPSGKPYQPYANAPILLIGDSNLLWWQSNKGIGSGLGAQVALQTQHPVDEYSESGFLPHRMRSHVKSLTKRKKVILLQSAWLLWDTRSRWRLFQ